MLKGFENLPHRPNVAVLVCKDDKFLLVQKPHWGEDSWKLPQGGIDDGEDIESAGFRELKEETGIVSVEAIGVSKYTNTYDWSDDILKTLEYKKYKGQTQSFLVVKFIGSDSEISPEDSEISRIEWFSKEDIIELSEKGTGTFGEYQGIVPKIIEEFGL